MKIKKISLLNFGSYYGSHNFELADRGLTLVVGENLTESRMDSNGSGKSTLFEALDWCLFGKPTKTGLSDSIVNEEAMLENEVCVVDVDIVLDDLRSLVITRSRSKKEGKLKVIVGDTDITTLDSKETQKLLESYLGMDREVFHAAVFFAQTDLVRYADSTDTERMSILTKLMQLDEIDSYLLSGKEMVRVEENKLLELSHNIVFIESKLSGLTLVNFEDMINGWLLDHDKQLKDLRIMLASQEQSLDQILKDTCEQSDLFTRKEVLNQKLNNLQETQIPNELVVGRENYNKTCFEIDVYNRNMSDLQNRIGVIQTTKEGICSECGQRITKDHLQSEINRLQIDLANYPKYIAGLEVMKKQQADYVRAYENQYNEQRSVYQQNREKLGQEIAVLMVEVKNIEQKERMVKEYNESISSLRNKMGVLLTVENPYLKQKEENQKEQNKVRQELVAMQQKKNLVEEKLKYLKFWVNGFSAQGLKSYILDSKLQILTDAVNQWVKLLTGGSIWVRFESQKQTRKKTLVNAPDIRIFRWNPDNTITERAYKNWSGGEKKRISFAVDFGLSRLIASRAANKYDILILDEVFKYLDRGGREAIMEMLKLFAKEKSSVFVIEHDTEFQDMFENVVRAKKDGRRSFIVEAGNAA